GQSGLLRRRLLPVPARGGEGRAGVDARAPGVAIRQSDAPTAIERRALPSQSAHRVVPEVVARLVSRGGAHLSRADGCGRNLERSFAVVGAVAAHFRTARLFPSLPRRRGRLPPRRAAAFPGRGRAPPKTT